MGNLIIAATQKGIITKGGGHAMAAGLSVNPERVDDLKFFLNERLAPDLVGRPSVPGHYLDGALKIAGADMTLVETLKKVGPFGSANPEPRFVITNALITHIATVGVDQNHLRMSLSDEMGNRLNAIAFRAIETDMGQALVHHGGEPFHISGKIRNNIWQGRSTVQILVDDAAPVW